MEDTHDEFKIRMGKEIKKWRVYRRYSREYLAEKADISPKFLYEIEAGRKGCSSYVMYMLARSLDVDVNVLLEGSDERNGDGKNTSNHIKNMLRKDQVESILTILHDIIRELEK